MDLKVSAYIEQMFRTFDMNKLNESHDTTAEEFTSSVFDRIDINGDGELSLEMFLACACTDEDFMGVLMESLDLSHIVATIHDRRRGI